MVDIQAPQHNEPLHLGKGLVTYLIFLAVMAVVILIMQFFSGWIVLVVDGIAYLTSGIMLSRMVLRNIIIWHPIYNTLTNVTQAKLYIMLLWPMSYPILFAQLAVSKYL